MSSTDMRPSDDFNSEPGSLNASPGRNIDHLETSSTQGSSPPTWTPATGLMDMPNELLREIFISIPSGFTRTLWSLSLTCRQFRDIVERYLEPEYNLRVPVVDDAYDFMQRLSNQPPLKSIIRSVRLSTVAKNWYDRTPEQIDEIVCRTGLQHFQRYHITTTGTSSLFRSLPSSPALLLLALPELELLVVESNSRLPFFHVDSGKITARHITGFLGSVDAISRRFGLDYFTNLVSISLLYTNADSACAINDEFFQLPSLRKVVLRHIHFSRDAWSTAKYSSSVTELHLVDVLKYEVPWSKLLEIFSGLQKLRIDYRPQDVSFIHASVELFSSLYLQKHSLESLEIYSNDKYTALRDEPIAATRDEKVFDRILDRAPMPSFKPFTRLKSLSLTDGALVGISPHGLAYWHDPTSTTVDYLHRMLPDSLETFTHIVWDGPTGYDALLSSEDRHLRSWDRIWKVAEHDVFPSLRKVDEVRYGLHGVKERRLVWEFVAVE